MSTVYELVKQWAEKKKLAGNSPAIIPEFQQFVLNLPTKLDDEECRHKIDLFIQTHQTALNKLDFPIESTDDWLNFLKEKAIDRRQELELLEENLVQQCNELQEELNSLQISEENLQQEQNEPKANKRALARLIDSKQDASLDTRRQLNKTLSILKTKRSELRDAVKESHLLARVMEEANSIAVSAKDKLQEAQRASDPNKAVQVQKAMEKQRAKEKVKTQKQHETQEKQKTKEIHKIEKAHQDHEKQYDKLYKEMLGFINKRIKKAIPDSAERDAWVKALGDLYKIPADALIDQKISKLSAITQNAMELPSIKKNLFDKSLLAGIKRVLGQMLDALGIQVKSARVAKMAHQAQGLKKGLLSQYQSSRDGETAKPSHKRERTQLDSSEDESVYNPKKPKWEK